MLLRCLLPLALLPGRRRQRRLYPHRPDADLQSYRVDAQKERIAMYWQDRHGKARGSCVRCWRVSMATAGCRWR